MTVVCQPRVQFVLDSVPPQRRLDDPTTELFWDCARAMCLGQTFRWRILLVLCAPKFGSKMKGGTTDKSKARNTHVNEQAQITKITTSQQANIFAGHSLHTAEAVIHSIHSELNGPGRVGSRLELVEACWPPLNDGPWYPIFLFDEEWWGYIMLLLALFPIFQVKVSRFYINFPLLLLRPSRRQVAKIISQRASFLASTPLCQTERQNMSKYRSHRMQYKLSSKISESMSLGVVTRKGEKKWGLLIGVDLDRGNEPMTGSPPVGVQGS